MIYQDKPSKIIGEAWDTKVTVEKPTSQVTINEYVDMCFSVLVGLSFAPDAVIEAMQEFIDERNCNQ